MEKKRENKSGLMSKVTKAFTMFVLVKKYGPPLFKQGKKLWSKYVNKNKPTHAPVDYDRDSKN